MIKEIEKIEKLVNNSIDYYNKITKNYGGACGKTLEKKFEKKFLKDNSECIFFQIFNKAGRIYNLVCKLNAKNYEAYSNLYRYMIKKYVSFNSLFSFTRGHIRVSHIQFEKYDNLKKY